jgi:hypothetical protein
MLLRPLSFSLLASSSEAAFAVEGEASAVCSCTALRSSEKLWSRVLSATGAAVRGCIPFEAATSASAPAMTPPASLAG